MAYENFERCLTWLLVHEGGYVDHPRDPGGATNRGVTQRVYDAYRRRKGHSTQSVKHVAEQEVRDIYRRQYWDEIWGDEMPSGLDYAVFDFAVNSGPVRAVKFLQELLGVEADGIIGNVTMSAALDLTPEQHRRLIEKLCNKRLAWMKRLTTWDTFGRGWKRRVVGEHEGVQHADTGVVDRACKLISGDLSAIKPPPVSAPGKAEDQDARPRERVRDEVFNTKNIATAVSGAAVTTIPQLAADSDAVQYGIAAAIVVGAVGAVVVFVLKARAQRLGYDWR